MNKEIMKRMPAIMAAIGKLCCTVDPTLRFPINLGKNVPPNNPTAKIMPNILPYKLLSNFAKVTPIIVGKIGAKASPTRRTATIAKIGLLAIIISKIASTDKMDINIITFGPIAVKFFMVEVKNLPVVMAAPNKLSTNPAFVDAETFKLPP